ncbi:MAG: sugar transferase [Lachnospiraceae bacterium]|nr:sugar transferase [Candidatus Colinaster equi]
MNSFYRKNNLIQTYTLLLIDMVTVVLAYLAAFWLRYRSYKGFDENAIMTGALLLLFCVLNVVVLDWNHYIFKRGYFDELVAVFKYDVILLIALGFCIFLLRQGEYFSRLVFGYFGVLVYILTYVSHILFKKYMINYYRRSNSADKLLLVTRREYVQSILADMRMASEWSYHVSAIALLGDCDETQIDGIPVIACGDNMEEGLTRATMDTAFLYLPDESNEVIERYVNYFDTMGVDCSLSVANVHGVTATKSVGTVAGHVVVTYSNRVIDYRRRFVKRAFDIVISFIGLLITLVFTPFIALAIAIDSRGPVIYSQNRVGRNGRVFRMYKFRSMYTDADERKKELMKDNELSGPMFKMENDPRITKVGRFIRKTSIDELPQFYNILKGDMSLIGTRPPTVEEFEQYNMHYRRRLSITPGLTGLWQVSGRSDIEDFDDVVKLDLEYIDNWSLALDAKIFLQTIGVVLLRKGSK